MSKQSRSPIPNSPVFDRSADGRSVVARPAGSWGFASGLCAIALLGGGVFLSLSHGRTAHAQGVSSAGAPAAPPGPVGAIPQSPVQNAGVARLSAATATPPAAMAAAAPVTGADNGELAARWKAPAMVVDLAPQEAPSASAPSPSLSSLAGGPKGQKVPEGKLSAEEQFAQRVSDSSAETAHASRLSDTALVAPQGTVIPAILETAINSDLPGFARAVVTRDVRGFDGTRVLIPRGSKLIGQYRSGAAAGQSRAFVVWSRLLTPEGISIDIGSPAADRLGRGGLDGETNTHFFKRFGASILLSVLSAGLDATANSGSNNSSTAIVIGSPQQANNVASIALQKQIDIPDTITVAQGSPIRVFVARDLDFSDVMTKSR